MQKTILKPFSTPGKSIVRWFLICFLSFSLIFLITLLPLISYCRSVFTDLEIKKSTQQMDFGISQLENTVNGVNSAAYNLKSDIRFLPFFYRESDYSSITVSVRNQMMSYLNGLMFPLTLVSDCTLQFSENTVITPTRTMFDENYLFYPDRFKVDDLTYEEWTALLSENDTGFLPVSHVTTTNGAYDALIYSLPIMNGRYFYVCLKMDDIKRALIDTDMLDSCYLTLTDLDGHTLHTDLSDSPENYHSVTQRTSVGQLSVTVHIPKSALSSKMTPLYYFLGVYLLLCIVVLCVTVFIGSHLSSKPLLQIIRMLEHSEPQSIDFPEGADSKKQVQPFHYGFHYIQNRVQSYETNLNTYRNTIATQAKVLQARFLEKALHGSLTTDKEFEQFFSYFPDFPESYCLIQFGLIEQSDENGTLYPDALSMIQIYLENSLPKAYLQQLNSSELLMIIDEEDAEEYSHIINYLIENINREEPSYHAWGITSKCYSHPKSLPTAYWQLQDLYSRISTESLSGLCTASDVQNIRRAGFQLSDILSIHTAITSGNRELALLKLQSYSENQSTNNRPTFELLRSILLCIKRDYVDLLIDEDIPTYRPHLSLYDALENTVVLFCDRIQAIKTQAEIDPFIEKVKAYIDLHFTEDDLCLTKLADCFQCSSSKIQKAFSKEVGVAVSVYIEKKRMELANQLLLEGEYSVTEVGRKCGFANDNTFYKAYRRVFGHAPTSAK
ncbi:MAG: helix-turn-helix transcriptional regulator [Lachnospiraceae bacterium]|nr:helix-turn-helix transcriptional regulator [Lachnospiraceae bacterium]